MVFFATIWAVAVFCNTPAALQQSFYNPYSQAIVLTSSECDTLTGAPRTDHRWGYYGNETDGVKNALFELAHELGHGHDPDLVLTGWTSPYLQTCSQAGVCEAYADCYALGHVAALARTLGFSGYSARH